MLTLVEAQKLIQDEVQAGVVFQTYIQNPILNLLPFETITGNSVAYNRVNGLAAGGNTRAINADYAEGTVGFTRLTAALGRLGGKASVDNFLQVTGSNVTDQLATQVEAKARATAIHFQNEFFNGDTAVDANGYDGLKKLLAGTSQDSTAATVIKLEELDEALLAVAGDPSAIFMNDKTLLKVNALAKGTGMVQYQTLDMVGAKISAYAGVPILRAGRNGAGQILADGEIYIVKMGADGVHGIQANTPSVSVFEPNAQSPSWTARIDWYAGIKHTALDSAYRLKRTLV